MYVCMETYSCMSACMYVCMSHATYVAVELKHPNLGHVGFVCVKNRNHGFGKISCSSDLEPLGHQLRGFPDRLQLRSP